MGDLKYLEAIKKEINVNESLKKQEIQYNLIIKLACYLGYDVGTTLSYKKLGKNYVDCVIEYNSVVLPILVMDYNKSRRDKHRGEGCCVASSKSVLTQILSENKLKIGLITDGYNYYFYESIRDGAINLKRELTLFDVINTKGVRDFLDNFSRENIEGYYEKLNEEFSLSTYMHNNIFQVFENLSSFVSKRFKGDFTEKELFDFFVKEGENYLNNVKGTQNIVSENIEVNQDFIWYPKHILDGINEILKVKKSDAENLALLRVLPKKVYFCNGTPFIVHSWLDIFVNALNKLYLEDKLKYRKYIDTISLTGTMTIIQGSETTDKKIKGGYRKLLSGDFITTAADRRTLSRYTMDVLKYLNPNNFSMTFMYSPDCCFNITSLETVKITKELHQIEQVSQLTIEDTTQSLLQNTKSSIGDIKLGQLKKSKDYRRLVKESIGYDYIIYDKEKQHNSYKWEDNKKLIEDILNAIQKYDLKLYEEVKKLKMDSYFFIVTPERRKDLKYYHKERKLMNNDTFVVYTNSEETLALLDFIAKLVGFRVTFKSNSSEKAA